MTKYEDKYPEWKKLWLKIPPLRRAILSSNFLCALPEERWADIVANACSPACSERSCMCFEESGVQLPTCETLPRRHMLLREGLIDEWGQYKGCPGFGSNPDPLEGFTYSTHKDVNAYDYDHGEKDTPIVEDLGLPTVMEGIAHHGDKYLVLPDGRHGPQKFSSRAEKLEYLKKTGHREKRSFTH